MSSVDAVVLAGSSRTPEHGNRAMKEIAGRPMVQWVVDALRASSSVGRIVVVGDVTAEGVEAVYPSGEGMVDNIRIGADALGDCERLLSVCADIPFLTAESVDDFVARGIETGGEFVYPVISREDCQAAFPGMKRTYLKTAEGTFTGGNITLISAVMVRNNWELISQAHAARKEVLKLAGLIGWGVLVRVIVGQLIPATLKLSALEKAASRVMGAKAVALPTRFAGIGADIDKPDDFAVAELLLNRQPA